MITNDGKACASIAEYKLISVKHTIAMLCIPIFTTAIGDSSICDKERTLLHQNNLTNRHILYQCTHLNPILRVGSLNSEICDELGRTRYR